MKKKMTVLILPDYSKTFVFFDHLICFTLVKSCYISPIAPFFSYNQSSLKGPSSLLSISTHIYLPHYFFQNTLRFKYPPLLFNLYINDLPDSVHHRSHLMTHKSINLFLLTNYQM